MRMRKMRMDKKRILFFLSFSRFTCLIHSHSFFARVGKDEKSRRLFLLAFPFHCVSFFFVFFLISVASVYETFLCLSCSLSLRMSTAKFLEETTNAGKFGGERWKEKEREKRKRKD
jgi:hypothetical protein